MRETLQTVNNKGSVGDRLRKLCGSMKRAMRYFWGEAHWACLSAGTTVTSLWVNATGPCSLHSGGQKFKARARLYSFHRLYRSPSPYPFWLLISPEYLGLKPHNWKLCLCLCRTDTASWILHLRIPMLSFHNFHLIMSALPLFKLGLIHRLCWGWNMHRHMEGDQFIHNSWQGDEMGYVLLGWRFAWLEKSQWLVTIWLFEGTKEGVQTLSLTYSWPMSSHLWNFPEHYHQEWTWVQRQK